jgi:hypothetical protein
MEHLKCNAMSSCTYRSVCQWILVGALQGAQKAEQRAPNGQWACPALSLILDTALGRNSQSITGPSLRPICDHDPPRDLRRDAARHGEAAP